MKHQKVHIRVYIALVFSSPEFSFEGVCCCIQRRSQEFGMDDGLKWLSSDKSLRDQGVDEEEVVVLRKRYYFTDKNLDENEPVQLGLLYLQCQRDIVEGTHPCTKDEAVKFASLQRQVCLFCCCYCLGIIFVFIYFFIVSKNFIKE